MALLKLEQDIKVVNNPEACLAANITGTEYTGGYHTETLHWEREYCTKAYAKKVGQQAVTQHGWTRFEVI